MPDSQLEAKSKSFSEQIAFWHEKKQWVMGEWIYEFIYLGSTVGFRSVFKYKKSISVGKQVDSFRIKHSVAIKIDSPKARQQRFLSTFA